MRSKCSWNEMIASVTSQNTYSKISMSFAACLLRRQTPRHGLTLQKCHKGQVLATEYCPGNGQQVAY